MQTPSNRDEKEKLEKDILDERENFRKPSSKEEILSKE